ncbi:SCO4225 family membrane protein [Streptomyces sp. NPDC048172]|uniref:SCO4225 family membrane protein n=1 Tax=Streptomyces sp. NPDC048172 TaxID=3365505 RepID=UPI00371C710F
MSTAHAPKEADVMAGSGSGSTSPSPRSGRSGRDALGSALAGGYLILCAALLVWAVVVSNGDNPDASFAGVIPIFATAPVSMVFLVLPDHASALYIAVGLGALVNAALIHWCARALRRGLKRG